MVLEPDVGAVAPSVELPYRLTGTPSRRLGDVVALVHRLVMDGVASGAWGALQVPWPIPAGVWAEAVFHVSPTTVPGWPDQRQYSVALALAFISALTGRTCVPGLVAIGELTMDGRMLPLTSMDEAELDLLEQVVRPGSPPMQVLMPSSGALRLKSLVARKGSPRVQQNVEVMGVDCLSDAVLFAFEG